MKADNISEVRANRVWLRGSDCGIEEFAAQQARQTRHADYPLAAEIVRNIPVYDGAAIFAVADLPEPRKLLQAEWVEAMLHGPGVVVLRAIMPDTATLDATTAQFFAIIEEQRATGAVGADHFAKPGANDRIWNALEKLCLRDPALFATYYGNAAVAMVSEAWLGPGYQITAQVNCVNPGGVAQSAHRDYHLGFQSAEVARRFPAHVHELSPLLTLQGAVAHCDMPIESGPTLYLPFSQSYRPGYLATGRPEFAAYFDAHHVQLPLLKGDAVFFNPALFHAAGHNRSREIRRTANLLQVSSAFGRAMESVDRLGMCRALYPVLHAMRASRHITAAAATNAIAAAAEGYPFPTNLDRDPPLGGLAPETQQALMQRALDDGWAEDRLASELDRLAWRKLT